MKDMKDMNDMKETDSMKNTNEAYKNQIENIKKALKKRDKGTIGPHKFFSVFIPVVETKNGPSLLFEVRASKLKSQPGDICFPGGQLEEGETPLECGLREFHEEVGIDQGQVQVLGAFDTLYGFSGYTIYTFVVAIDEKAMESMTLSRDEVSEVFTVPLDFFRETPAKSYDVDVVSDVEDFPYEETGIPPDYNWKRGKNILPLYRYQERVIWGITGRIVEHFANMLLK